MRMSPLQSLTAKFYTHTLLNDLVLIYPLYTLMFADSGVSPAQITSILVAWSAVTFLLEVPSGAIADKYSRKMVLFVALLFKAAGFAAMLAFPTYPGFLTGFILWGINGALKSGTQEALVYDELARLKQLPLYAKVIGRMASLRLVGTIGAAFGASVLAPQGYRLLLAFSVVAILLSAVAVLTLPKSKKVESTGESSYFSYLREGIRDAFKRSEVLIILAFGAIIALVSVDEYFGLLFREKGFSNSAVSLWDALIGVFGIVGSLLAHKLENKKFSLELLLLFWAGLLLAGALTNGLAAPAFICLFAAVYYTANVIFMSRLQRVVSDKTRATTTSVGGLLEEVVALSVFAIIGLSASTHEYQFGFSLVALLIVIMALLFWCFSRFVKRRQELEKLGL